MAGKAVKKRAEGKPVQYDTIKVRLYPTVEQKTLFKKTFGCCRYIWNKMLKDSERFYSETGKHFIPTPAKYKASAPFLKEVDNQALTQEYNKLSQAYRVYFKDSSKFGHPKPKRKKDDKDSFTACNHDFESGPTIYTTRDAIRMTKAGLVTAKFPRRARNGWKLKRITVERSKTDKYYCSILYERPEKEPEKVEATPERTVGIKYSAAHFYVTDSGESAELPDWIRKTEEQARKLQQELSRKEHGSRNYEESVKKYRKLCEHITNQRRDYLHKESRRIANAWDAVRIGDEDRGEVGSNVRNGKVKGTGFGRFREMLRYKLERQGKELIETDRRSREV